MNFMSSHRRRLLVGGLGAAVAAGVGATIIAQRRRSSSDDLPGDLATVELQRAEQRAGICTEANAAGVGLRGEYFASASMVGTPLLVRVDGPVDFDAHLDWPADRSAQRPTAVRWSGWIKPPVTGRYRFHAADDARLSVSSTPVAGLGTAGDTSIELAAGRFYPVLFELPHIASAVERIRLEWTAPYGSRFVVPRALLYLPSDSVNTR